MAESPRSPRAPVGLGKGGKRLWRDVTGVLELRPDELMVLEHACHTVDELGRLREDFAESPVTVFGSRGQPRPNGLLDELRKHRQVLAQLLGSIDVPDEAGEAEERRKASTNIQASALRRWANYRQEQEQGRGA